MFDDWMPLVERFGVPVTMLLVVVVTGARRWWAYGWYVRAVETERDFWRDLALRGTALAEQQTHMAREALNVTRTFTRADGAET